MKFLLIWSKLNEFKFQFFIYFEINSLYNDFPKIVHDHALYRNFRSFLPFPSSLQFSILLTGNSVLFNHAGSFYLTDLCWVNTNRNGTLLINLMFHS